MEHWINWHLSICNSVVIVKYLFNVNVSHAKKVLGGGGVVIERVSHIFGYEFAGTFLQIQELRYYGQVAKQNLIAI